VEVEARPAAVGLFEDVGAAQVGLAHAGGPELLDDRSIEPVVGPSERRRPEARELARLGAGPRPGPVGVREALEAEPVALRVADDRERVRQLADPERLHLDQASAEPEDALARDVVIGHADVEVDRDLDRRRLRLPAEAQGHVLVARVASDPSAPFRVAS
jgi:hypothetical protein